MDELLAAVTWKLTCSPFLISKVLGPNMVGGNVSETQNDNNYCAQGGILQGECNEAPGGHS